MKDNLPMLDVLGLVIKKQEKVVEELITAFRLQNTETPEKITDKLALIKKESNKLIMNMKQTTTTHWHCPEDEISNKKRKRKPQGVKMANEFRL